MDKATSGTVRFDGREITSLDEKELADVRLDEMGFIFQQMYMMKNLSILDNILLPAMQSRKEGISREEKVKRAFREELRGLYRMIAKALHPDLHPDLTERERDLFLRAVSAYRPRVSIKRLTRFFCASGRIASMTFLTFATAAS